MHFLEKNRSFKSEVILIGCEAEGNILVDDVIRELISGQRYHKSGIDLFLRAENRKMEPSRTEVMPK